MKYNPQCAKLIAAAKQNVTEIDADAVKSMLEGAEDLVLLDVRSDAEWQTEHLPDARHIDRGKLEFQIEKAVPEANTKIIVYCGGGGRAALAASTLKEMGYQQVISIAGGYRAWKQAGYPLVSE